MDDLERRRVTNLADELLLRLRGGSRFLIEEVAVDEIDHWRIAARQAGQRLGWRVRTGVQPGSRCWIADVRAREELTAEERLRDELADRRLAETMGRLLRPRHIPGDA